MFTDPETIQDLHVLPGPGSTAMSLWSLLDRTRTRCGRETLRARLLAPSHHGDEIVALQQAHRLLAEDSSSYRTLLDRADIDFVEAYLSSSWQLPRDMPALSRLRGWHKQYVAEAADGRTGVMTLLETAHDLSSRLSGAGNSVLGSIGHEMRAKLDEPGIEELRAIAPRSSSAARRAFDQQARADARSLLLALVACVGRVEAMWSLGAATLEHGWSYPSPSVRLRATGVVHPFLGPGAVANDLHLGDSVRVCLITGPNMAGKSTFVKAIGIAVILAHIGCGVPAVSMEFRPVGAVVTSIDLVDNLNTGESLYLAGVRRIGALATALCEYGSVVAVIDEPFRGTNVHDAAEATMAVVSRFAQLPAALVFLTSHLGELASGLASDENVALLHFAADTSGERPQFDYALREGASSQRLGMTLLRQSGVLELLTRAATSAPPTG